MIYAPSALLKAVRGMLLNQIGVFLPTSYLGRVSMLVSSDKDSETYAWLGEAPRMRQITDDATIIYDQPTDTNYSISNVLWKSGIIVRRKDIDDQQVDAITRRIRELARVAMAHVNRLTISALTANGTGYDGVALFSDTHTARGLQTAAQDNNLASSGTTVAQIQADVMDAIEQLSSFIGENNEPLFEDITRITVVHSVQIMGNMREAIRAAIIGNQSNERFAGFSFDLIQSARLTTAATYYVVNSSDASNLPVVIQERDPLETAEMTSGDDAFDNEQLKYSCRWRGNSGYGHWQTAVRVS